MENPYKMVGLLGLVGRTEEERGKISAWYKATEIPFSSDRIDCDGRIIRWEEYGQTATYGWEIDHIAPTVFGSSDHYSNLRARHWQGNRTAGGLLGGLTKGSAPGLWNGLFGESGSSH